MGVPRQGEEGALVARILRLVLGLLMVVSVWSLMPQSARADGDLLEASDPDVHQELTGPPSGVVLAFTRKVDASAAQIVVTNSAGDSVNINSLIVEGTNVTAQVKPNLPKGTYTVHYQVNRSDGQVEGGAFQFAYGKGAWTALSDERWSGNSAQPTVIATAGPGPASATPSDSQAATAVPTDSASASPVPGADGGGLWLWVGLGVGVVAVVAIAAAAWLRRGKAGRGQGSA